MQNLTRDMIHCHRSLIYPDAIHSVKLNLFIYTIVALLVTPLLYESRIFSETTVLTRKPKTTYLQPGVNE